MRKLARQIDELQRQVPTGLGPWPHRLLWQCASTRANKLESQILTSGHIDASKNETIKRADALAAKQDHDAIARWRSKIQLDFRHRSRETFKWFSRSYRSVQHFVKDGTHFVADPIFIEKLICAIWSPIFRRPKSETSPSWQTFVQAYGHYLPVASPLRLKLLAAELLRRTLAKMSGFS